MEFHRKDDTQPLDDGAEANYQRACHSANAP